MQTDLTGMLVFTMLVVVPDAVTVALDLHLRDWPETGDSCQRLSRTSLIRLRHACRLSLAPFYSCHERRVVHHYFRSLEET